MELLKGFCRGFVSVLNVTAAPMLYRYPYRISAEGMRADWGNISQDIQNVLGRLDEFNQDTDDYGQAGPTDD